jgi:hypothetical protein
MFDGVDSDFLGSFESRGRNNVRFQAQQASCVGQQTLPIGGACLEQTGEATPAS